jgi:hypothetical protein
MAGIVIAVGTIVFVGCVTAVVRLTMRNNRFNDRPGPRHIGS